jgi:fibronectin type 3 domain-containing protein
MFKSLKFFVVVSGLFLFSGLPLYARSMEQKDTILTQKKLSVPCAQQRVHRVGNVNFSVTNWGFVGSETRYEDESYGGCFNPYPDLSRPAPSFEFPSGSGLEYLFLGAIWVGGIVEGETLVSVGADGWLQVNEMFPDKDPDGCIKEKSISSVTPNCNPPDTFGAISEQDIIAEYTDTLVEGLNEDDYDKRPHKPLDIRIIQKSYSWSGVGFDKFIIVDYNIINIGSHNLDSTYIGFFYDGDVYHISKGATGFLDDITGFKSSYVSPVNETTEVNLIWLADDNGDPTAGDWEYRSVRGATAIKVLEGPNPALKYSFNWWVSNGYDSTLDWGPWKVSSRDRWFASTGRNSFLDGNLGTPTGDKAKYFLMSNGELDYDQIRTCIDYSDSGWLPPSSGCYELANGGDAKYLLSFGPFELLSQDTLHFVVAFIAGDSFHIYANNPIDPYNPDSFYNKLNFEDLVHKAIRAESLYQSGYTYVTPPKPFNLEAKYMGEGEVLLNWTKVEKGFVVGYNIYRGTQSGVYNDTQFYAQPTDSISYIDSGLVVGQIYYYAVTSVNSIGESGKSDELAVVVGGPQVRPEGVKVSDNGDGNSLHLEWQTLPDTTVTGFRVHYGTASGIYTRMVDAGYTFNYDLTGLGADTTYYIVLTAYNQSLIEGFNSNQVSGTPHSIPMTPTGFEARAGNRCVDLVWNANKELDLAGYKVFRRRMPPGPRFQIAQVSAPTTFYSDTMVYNDSNYQYSLLAVDKDSNESGLAYSYAVTPDIAQIGNLYFYPYDYVFGWGNADLIPNPGEYLQLYFRIQNLSYNYLLNPKAIAQTDDPCIYKAYIESDTLYGESAPPNSYARFDYHPVRGGRYWQRYLVMIRSDCPSGDSVYIPLDFYDHLNTYVGSDTISFQVVGTDSTPPRAVQVDCYPKISTGTDTIMALIEDGADIKEALALIKNSLDSSLIASLPLHDDGINGDLQAGDRVFSGIYTGGAVGDFYVDISATDIFNNSLVSKKLAGFSTKTFQTNNSILFYHRYGGGDFSRWIISGNNVSGGFYITASSRGAWLSALDSLGKGYDFWDEFYRGEVPSNILLGYTPDGQIIYTDDFGDLSVSSKMSLIDLLSNYGKLLISSGALGLVSDTTAFYRQYLHADLITPYFNAYYPTDGVLGVPQEQMFLGNFFPFITQTGFCEEIDPVPPATTVLKYHASNYQSSGSAAIKYVNYGSADSTRVIYYAFNWANLSNADRYRLLKGSHTWLVTEVEEEYTPKGNLPDRFSLFQNYPNPFNPNTLIEYALPQASLVKLVIYNILGQKVKVLVDEYQKPGYKRILWDGKNGQGQMVSSGIYFYQLKAGEQVFTKKMIMVK